MTISIHTILVVATVIFAILGIFEGYVMPKLGWKVSMFSLSWLCFVLVLFIFP